MKGCSPAAQPALKKASEGVQRAGDGSMEATSGWTTGSEAAQLGKPGKGREELQGAASARVSAPAETATTAQKLSGEEGMGSSFPFLVEQKLAFR